MSGSEASFRGAYGWRECQEQKQASMETLHQDLREIIRLLRDIQRNQFAFYAAEHYQMTPRAGESNLTDVKVCVECDFYDWKLRR